MNNSSVPCVDPSSELFWSEQRFEDPSTKEFYDVFRFLISQLDSVLQNLRARSTVSPAVHFSSEDPQLEVEGKMEDEVPSQRHSPWLFKAGLLVPGARHHASLEISRGGQPIQAAGPSGGIFWRRD